MKRKDSTYIYVSRRFRTALKMKAAQAEKKLINLTDELADEWEQEYFSRKRKGGDGVDPRFF